MLCLYDLIIASDRTFLNYLVSLLLLLVKSSYKFYWSLPGVGMRGPRSLPGGGHAWSQVPCLVPGPFQVVGMPDPRSLVRGMFTMGAGYVQTVGVGISEGTEHVYQRGWIQERVESGYIRGQRVYQRVGVYQRGLGWASPWIWDLGYPPPVLTPSGGHYNMYGCRKSAFKTNLRVIWYLKRTFLSLVSFRIVYCTANLSFEIGIRTSVAFQTQSSCSNGTSFLWK